MYIFFKVWFDTCNKNVVTWFLIPLPQFSYIYWLIHFNFNILFRNISAVIFILGRFTLVSLSRTGTLAFGSFVKALTNCFWRIFAFSLSSNFVKVSTSLSCKRGATPVWVLSLLRTCDQNIFGLRLDWIPIFLSNSLFDSSLIALTLFLALVCTCRTISASETFKTAFDFWWHPSLLWLTFVPNSTANHSVVFERTYFEFHEFQI